MGSGIHQICFYSTSTALSGDQAFSLVSLGGEREKIIELSDSSTITVIGGNALYTYIPESIPVKEVEGHLIRDGETVTINGSNNIRNVTIIPRTDEDTIQVFVSFNAHALTGTVYGWPINFDVPEIDDPPIVDAELQVITPGVWYPTNVVRTYQWQKSLDEETWENIPLATGTSYTPTINDYNYYLRVIETANGTNSIESYASSDPVALPEF